MTSCDHRSEHSRRSAATGRPSDAMFLFFFFHFSPKGRTVLVRIVEEAVSRPAWCAPSDRIARKRESGQEVSHGSPGPSTLGGCKGGPAQQVC